MEQALGKLIVSTKANKAGMVTLSYIILVFDCILALCCILFSHLLLGRQFSNFLFVVLLICIILGSGIINFIIIRYRYKSYCHIYEYGVAGRSNLSFNHPHAVAQAFQLSYPEILNVSEAGRSLIIRTQYNIYEVYAPQNRSTALEEIRSRISLH